MELQEKQPHGDRRHPHLPLSMLFYVQAQRTDTRWSEREKECDMKDWREGESDKMEGEEAN